MPESRADTHYHRGLAAIEQRELERAVCEFRGAIESSPKHAKAHRELGWVIYGSGGSLDEAATLLERALELDQSLDDAHLYLAIILNRQSKHDESESHFRMALSLTNEPAHVHSTFAEDFLWHNGRYGEAEHHFGEALGHDPDCVLALRDYARMLSCHGRDSEAKRLFEKALELDPNDKSTIRAYDKFLADLVAEDRDPDECLRSAVERDPDYTEGIRCLSNRSK